MSCLFVHALVSQDGSGGDAGPRRNTTWRRLCVGGVLFLTEHGLLMEGGEREEEEQQTDSPGVGWMLGRVGGRIPEGQTQTRRARAGVRATRRRLHR